jgi:amino acid efflux transporter
VALPLGPALLVCFFGFIGWENAAPVAEEVVNPRRTFPKAIAAAVIIVGVLYLVMALTVLLSLPKGASRAEGITAFSTVLANSVGSGAATAGKLVAFALLALTTNAWCLGTSRVVYSIARKGLLPARIATVDHRGTPRAAVLTLVVGYGASVGVLAILNLNESALITATSAAFLIIFLTAVLAGTRILTQRRLRMLSWTVAVVTVILLPFFGPSLPWAALIAVAAVVLERVSRREGSPSIQPAPD